MIGDKLIGKDVEGTYRGLKRITAAALSWRV
jgi:hypothetical protein